MKLASQVTQIILSIIFIVHVSGFIDLTEKVLLIEVEKVEDLLTAAFIFYLVFHCRINPMFSLVISATKDCKKVSEVDESVRFDFILKYLCLWI